MKLLDRLQWRSWCISGRDGWAVLGIFLTFLLFDIIWSAGTTFRGLSRVETYSNALLVALILTLPYMLTRRVWVQGIVMLLLDALLISNLMYCRTYMTAIPLSSYMLAGNLREFGDSVLDNMRFYDALLPLFTILWWYIALRMPKTKQPRIWAKYGAWIAVLTLLSWLLLLPKGGFVKRYEWMRNSCYFATVTTTSYTVFGDIAYGIVSSSRTVSETDIRDAEEWFAYQAERHPYVSIYPDSVAPQRKSLVLILLESFESWPIDKTIDGNEITPVINSLLKDTTTLYVPNVLTQVGDGRSIEAQLLINAGLLPMENAVYSMLYPDRDYPTLTKAIAGKSYLLSPDRPYMWNQGVIAKAFGIDSLLMDDAWQLRGPTVGTGKGRLSDRELMLQTVEKMRNGEIWPVGDPAFVQIICFSGHAPFRLPDALRGVTFSESIPEKMADYLTCTNFVDSTLDILLQYLKTRPDYDDMLIVITGDHEGLADWRKDILATPAGRANVSDKQYTPLIVVNSPVSGRYDKVIGQIDIYPTILNLLGLDDYPWKGVGESLFSATKIPAAVSTMTKSIEGDTLGLPAPDLHHLLTARHTSDTYIKSQLPKREQ